MSSLYTKGKTPRRSLHEKKESNSVSDPNARAYQSEAFSVPNDSKESGRTSVPIAKDHNNNVSEGTSNHQTAKDNNIVPTSVAGDHGKKLSSSYTKVKTPRISLHEKKVSKSVFDPNARAYKSEAFSVPSSASNKSENIAKNNNTNKVDDSSNRQNIDKNNLVSVAGSHVVTSNAVENDNEESTHRDVLLRQYDDVWNTTKDDDEYESEFMEPYTKPSVATGGVPLDVPPNSIKTTDKHKTGSNNKQDRRRKTKLPVWKIVICILLIWIIIAVVIGTSVSVIKSNQNEDDNDNEKETASPNAENATPSSPSTGGGVPSTPTNVVAPSPTAVAAPSLPNMPSVPSSPSVPVTSPAGSSPTTPNQPTMIVPVVPGQPTFNPTSAIVTPTGLCIQNGTELKLAVLSYLGQDNNSSIVTRTTYGDPIGTWCVGNVTDFSLLFSGIDYGDNIAFYNPYATTFNEDISNWNTSSAQYMTSMFEGATNFNQDLSQWDTRSVTRMDFMFRQAESFNQNIGSWDVSKVTTMYNMFYQAKSFNQNLSNWNTTSVTTMENMFNDAIVFNGDISLWDVSSVQSMKFMFAGAFAFDQDLSQWDVSSVTTMASMFQDTPFNSNIVSWDVSSVKDMSWMFFQDRSFNQNITNWNVSAVRNMELMFYGASSFNADLSKWNIQSVNSSVSMFEAATLFNSNISNWDVSSVRDMTSMFARASSFSQDLCLWGTKLHPQGPITTSMFENAFGCPTTNSPNPNVVPPGPFCYPCA